MLNETTITQARTAILSRNESVSLAFVKRTEDGIFMAVGKEISKSPLDDLEAKWLGYEWLANSKMFNPENVQKQYREQNEAL